MPIPLNKLDQFLNLSSVDEQLIMIAEFLENNELAYTPTEIRKQLDFKIKKQVLRYRLKRLVDNKIIMKKRFYYYHSKFSEEVNKKS